MSASQQAQPASNTRSLSALLSWTWGDNLYGDVTGFDYNFTNYTFRRNRKLELRNLRW